MENCRDKIHNLVKGKYSEIAKGEGGISSCCGGSPPLITITELGKALDYEDEDLQPTS